MYQTIYKKHPEDIGILKVPFIRIHIKTWIPKPCVGFRFPIGKDCTYFVAQKVRKIAIHRTKAVSVQC
jgi:hypothetical protein